MGKYDDHKDRIIELKKQGLGRNAIAEQIKKETGEVLQPRKVSVYLKKWGVKLKPNGDYDSIIDETLHRGNLDTPWSCAWVRDTETGVSVLVKNVENILSEDNIYDVIADAVKDFKGLDIPKPAKTTKKALRGIISDAHVGMDSNTEDAMFGFEYNEKVFRSHLDKFYNALAVRVDSHGPFEVVYIDDLGDGLDGLGGETTRGGHQLPQNMSDREAWNTYVGGRIDMIMKVVTAGWADKYIFRNVTNDNHAGVFAWMAHRAIQIFCEQTLPQVEYVLLNKPIEHFYYGKHCFMLTHGKDARLMKKNWPLHITPAVENLIRDYIDHYNITSPYIHLDKGDLHNIGYDSRPKFDYRNFMSFAPPSAWVQAHFGVSYCGFSVQIIPRDSNEIEHTDIKFELKKL